jgi:glucosyl-dolichyl phosphate glucuronosyltransferase
MRKSMVSVIICTYNNADSLLKTLKSFQEITPLPEFSWELIVVDNNSKDNTKEEVERFRLASGIDVRYTFEGKQGLSHARNCGIGIARGEFIAFTDDDVLIDPQWLNEIVKTFEMFEGDCVGGKILPVWPGSRPMWFYRDMEGYLALLDYGDDVLVITQPNQMLFGANIAFSRAILDKVGPFNTSLGRKGKKLYSHEEKDLFERIILSGGKVVYQPRAIVHHVIGINRTNKAYFRKWRFDDGEHEAILLGEYGHRNIFGVPFFIVRKFFEAFFDWSADVILRRKDTCFRKELLLSKYTGFMCGRVKVYFHKT